MTADVRGLLRYDGQLTDPGATPGVNGKSGAAKAAARDAARLAELQEKLFANGKLGDRRRLVLVLQGLDASGKDGVVKHVVGQVNPAGCRITSFGPPTAEELQHDFLWRIARALPTPGQLGVLNRSHYEDVLVARVHDLVPRAVWSRRFGRINTFEKKLAASGCTVLKVFLHVSPEEQRKRLLARLDDKTKHWKIGVRDIGERSHWDDYQAAYLDVLSKTSTDVAPWYVIPADHKWYRNWAVGRLLTSELEALGLTWPTPAGIDIKAMRKDLLRSSATTTGASGSRAETSR